MKVKSILFAMTITAMTLAISGCAVPLDSKKNLSVTLIGTGEILEVPYTFGDTWQSAWAADDSLFFMNNDGNGVHTPSSVYAHDVISWLPAVFDPENPASLGNIDDGRHTINPRKGYPGDFMIAADGKDGVDLFPFSSDLYMVDGVLYHNILYSRQEPGNWRFHRNSMMRSLDGGRTWENHKGQIDTMLPNTTEDSFFQRDDWGHVTFVKYGKDGKAPNIDRADEFIYIVCWGARQIARIKREELARWNTSSGDADAAENVRNQLEYLTYGLVENEVDALECLKDEYWMRGVENARSFRDKKPLPWTSPVVYNPGLRCYFAAAFASDSFQKPPVEGSYTIFHASHPWGPWSAMKQENLSAKAMDNITWTFFAPKFQSADGKKMWLAVNGAHDKLGYTGRSGYILKFMPIYLTDEPVFHLSAFDAKHTQEMESYERDGIAGLRFRKTDDCIEFNLPIREAGSYIINFTYYTKRFFFLKEPFPTISIYLNGRKVKQLALARSEQKYGAWTMASEFIALPEGDNRVTFQKDADDWGPFVLADLSYALYTGEKKLPVMNPDLRDD